MSDYLSIELKNYSSIRSGNYPFPIDSILGYEMALRLSADSAGTADVLEIGVEHGGTALLSAQFLNESEIFYLVDLKKTQRFEDSFAKLPEKIRHKITFLEHSSKSSEIAFLSDKQFRFIHIDGGHSKQDVLDDGTRFGHLLAPNGVLVFDDVFEIRWPGVTEAVNEILGTSPIAPFMIIDRKLYCCRHQDHDVLLKAAQTSLKGIEAAGSVRSWVEPWGGWNTLIAKIIPSDETREQFQ